MLSNVIGNEPLKTLMLRMLKRNRLPQSLIFEGTPGCGRRTLSRAVAAALLCSDPSNKGDACGLCPSCVQCAAGTHPDVVELPHDTERRLIKVETIREMIVEEAYRSPLLGERRVFLLPAIDRLNPQSCNVLLKILEEPPVGAWFLMSKPPGNMVLNTIISRSQVFRMQSLMQADLRQVFMRQGMDIGEAEQALQIAHGSHRGVRSGETGDAGQYPRQALHNLLENGLVLQSVNAIVEALPSKSSDEAVTDAAWQRMIARQWLDRLQSELRVELRESCQERTLRHIQHIQRLKGDITLNLPLRSVVEHIALGSQ